MLSSLIMASVLTKEEALEWWSKHSNGSTCTPSDLPEISPIVQILGVKAFQINNNNEDGEIGNNTCKNSDKLDDPD